MPYEGSQSARVAEEITRISVDIRKGVEKAAKASSAEEVTRILEATRAVAMRDLVIVRAWADTMIPETFDNNFRAGAQGNRIPRGRQATYAKAKIKSKAVQASERMLSGTNRFFREQGDTIRVTKAIQALEKKQRVARNARDLISEKKMEADLQAIRQKYRGLLARTAGENEPKVPYYARTRSGARKAGNIIQRQMPLARYGEMVTQANHVRAENEGFLFGVIRNKSGKVVVFDGLDCGWKSHDDPQKAAGRLITAEEALSAPIAHPHCQRSFGFADKDGKEAAKRVAAERKAMAAKRAEEKKLLAKKAPTPAQKALKAAVIASQATAVIATVARSPFIKIMLRNLAEDIYELPAPLQKIVARWHSTAKLEEAMAIAEQRTVAEIRYDVIKEAEDLLIKAREDALTSVTLSNRAEKVLGVAKKTLTTNLGDSLDNYVEYTAHSRAQGQPWWLNVRDSHVIKQARDILYGVGDDIGAVKYGLNGGVGPSKGRAVRRTVGAIKRAYDKSPQILELEAVRTLANVIEPIPWLRANAGPLRFSVRSTARGREEIAEALYLKFRGKALKFTEQDRLWARELGINLQTRDLTKRDIINALVPRVTVNPGGVFGVTVALEGGNLVPVFRFMPPGGLRKVFALDTRLRAGVIDDIVRQMRSGRGLTETLQYIREKFTDIDENLLITNLNLWRNGPLTGNIRWYDNRVESYGVRLKPRNNWFNYLSRHHRAMFADEQENFLSEFAIMPGMFKGVRLGAINGEIYTTMAMLTLFRGSITEAAMLLGMDRDQALKMHTEITRRVGEYRQRLTQGELSRINSLDDLKKYLQGLVTLDDNIHNQLRKDGIEGIKLTDLKFGNRAFEQDVNEVRKLHLKMFPGEIPPMFERISIEDAVKRMGLDPDDRRSFLQLIQTQAFYDIRTKTVYVLDNWFQGWKGETLQVIKQGVKSGWNTPGADSRISLLWHEVGHHRAFNLPVRDQVTLWKRISKYIEGRTPGDWNSLNLSGVHDKDDIARRVDEWWRQASDGLSLRGALTAEVSTYGTYNAHELLAEAMAEYMTSRSPGELSSLIGEYLTGFYIRTREFFV